MLSKSSKQSIENYIQSLKLMCQWNLMKLQFQEKHTILTSKS